MASSRAPPPTGRAPGSSRSGTAWTDDVHEPVNDAYERLQRGDGMYRFVIGMKSLR
ncbi:hypothetical protein [Stigmatella aurantiaca]|uniref:hypothetical protein n=1 Tax=Stigmatella aurantiaca TaxID=41 RepID=UPI0016517040|nr:hypothetical protein [Stigmatella aurantiaca]